MEFTKMQGVGNDYIYVDCTEAGIDNPAKLAVKVSDVKEPEQSPDVEEAKPKSTRGTQKKPRQ